MAIGRQLDALVGDAQLADVGIVAGAALLDHREQALQLRADVHVLEQDDVVDERREALDAHLDLGAEQLLRLLGDEHGDVERAQLVRQRGDEPDRALGERGALAEAVDAVDHDALDLARADVGEQPLGERVEPVA